MTFLGQVDLSSSAWVNRCWTRLIFARGLTVLAAEDWAIAYFATQI